MLVPIASDQSRTRYPKLTITIIILCTVIYIFTYWIQRVQGIFMIPSAMELDSVETQLMVKYLEDQGENNPMFALRSLMQNVNSSQKFLDEFRAAMREGEVVPVNSSQYLLWETALDRFERATRTSVLYLFGYVPGDPGLVSIFTHMFLHGTFWHLFWNMYFFWLVGISLEDIWGRKYYGLIYLAGGIAAALTHHLMSIRSDMPMIGASGAIAALMGAYTIRFHKARLQFVFFKWNIWVVAWVPLLFWFGRELYYALRYWGESSGVAVWAHVGGYLFGLTAAVVLSQTKAEDTFIARALVKQDQKDQTAAAKKEAQKKAKSRERSPELQKGIEMRQLGRLDNAVEWLQAAIANDPEDFEARQELVRVYAQLGRSEEAAREIGGIIERCLAMKAMDQAFQWYAELDRMGLPPAAAGPWMYLLAQELQKRNAWEHAAVAYRGFARACSADARAPKALFIAANLIADRMGNPREAVVVLNFIKNRYPEWMPAEVENAKTMLMKKIGDG